MTRAVGKADYVYDGNGRRAWAWNSDGSHRGHAYTQDGQLLITGDPFNGDAWHVHLGGRHVGEIDQRDGKKHLYTDFLGSLVGRGTPAEGPQEWTRTRYEPYGRVSSGVQPFNVGYTGHVNDPDTGLIYMQQRYYDPVAGRFLSVDPVTTDADTGSTFNRYEYAKNNPYRYTDPDGRCSASRIDVAPGSICGGSGSALQAATASVAAAQQQVVRAVNEQVQSAARGAGNL